MEPYLYRGSLGLHEPHSIFPISPACRWHFYQAFLDDHGHLCEPVPENEIFVQRAAPHDRRAGGAPVSIIADFVK